MKILLLWAVVIAVSFIFPLSVLQPPFRALRAFLGLSGDCVFGRTEMTEFLMIMLLGYYIIPMGLGVLQYFVDRKRKNR